MDFVKSCPVCGKDGSKRRGDDESAPAAKRPRRPTTTSQQPSCSTAADMPSSSAAADQPSSGADTRTSSSATESDVAELARQSSLSKVEREVLYRAVSAQYAASVVTRSTLQSWLPEITSENVSYILLTRNHEATNAMLTTMEKATAKREQKLLDKFVRKN